MRKKLTDLLYSFPFQLLVLHLRSNLLLLGVWVLLALMVTGQFGGGFGLRYLFLSPEYLGQVGFLSFFYVGVGFGALVMSWNLTTYLLHASRFAFLASLERPFAKFVQNNMLLPVGYTLLFLACQVHFGHGYEQRPLPEVLWDSSGFLTGFATLVLAVATYFQLTNKDITNFDRRPPKKRRRRPAKETEQAVSDIRLNRNQWRVDTYLGTNLRPRLVRSVAHYDPATLLKIFQQNHLNALLVQLLTLVLLAFLGALMDRPAFRLPTATSIFLLSSMVIAITGAMSFWLGPWRLTGLAVVLLLINHATRYDLFQRESRAYGLDYTAAPTIYHPDSLLATCNLADVEADRKATLQILEKWRSKNAVAGGRKPKMVFFCVSGGGLKAAAWAMEVLQQADSLTSGRLLRQTVLMSGASGGMMGTSYYRELALRQQQGEPLNPLDPHHVHEISSDLLNPVSFAIVTNDVFMPWANFELGGQRFKKDRGYIFEKTLNENTRGRMDKPLAAYARPEQEAHVPLLFLTPSIVHDGRRLVISAQPVRYMMMEPAGVRQPGLLRSDAVDFHSLFASQNADSLRFLTALRMNATYPYILPNVTLPTDPPIEVLDAGFRDNFGLKSATRFIHVFKDWIKENTSGVVVVVVRSFESQQEIESDQRRGALETALNPLEIAFKVMSLQDYEHDNSLGLMHDLLGPGQLDVVRLTYHPSEALKDSPISFYLSRRERADLWRAVRSSAVRQELERLRSFLN